MMTAYDFIIIGSGFGGSVTAMRLAQKGYSVAILEKGRRYRASDFPTSNWNVRKSLWAPRLQCFGTQAITLLKGLLLLHGVGVGGGSLVYANTLIQPLAEQFSHDDWPAEINWQQELSPHYQTARQMLGVTNTPKMFEGELLLKKIAKHFSVENSFQPTPVGVFFGKENEWVKDPYFGGQGPQRSGCNYCGGCMVGCRHGAKNTLDYNYLYFAEKWGAVILPDTEATQIKPSAGGYEITTVSPTHFFRRKRQTLQAKKIILAAGVLGTIKLLLQNRDIFHTLPNISQRLGDRVRTNGESLTGATRLDGKGGMSKGIAIGAMMHPNPHTKIESVRYPKGSGVMRFLAVPLTPNANRWLRPFKMLTHLVRRFRQTCRLWSVRDWADNTLILLAMQTTDCQMQLRLGRSWLSAFRNSLQGKSVGTNPIPSYLPLAQEATEFLAKEISGAPQNAISEVLLATPATAHILGGCCLSTSATNGVVDPRHEVFGHPGLYVCDGSVIPCNLGANPSLTITALAERFATQFPIHPALPEEEWQKRQISYASPT